MSRLIPDFEPPKNVYHTFRPNEAIQAEIPTVEQPITLSEFKEALRKFAINFSREDMKRFDIATLSAKTAHNNRNTEHIWFLFKNCFIQSIKDTYTELPAEYIISITDKLNSVELSQFLKEDIDNMALLIYFLGIVNGLL